MQKVDFKKQLKHLYQPSDKAVVEVDVPAMNFLMVDGEGDPNTTAAYQEAVAALFSVAYALKFMVKRGEAALEYGVMPLEGLWWADDMSQFSVDNRTNWKWTMMIMQPDVVTEALVAQAIAETAKKKSLVALPLLRFERFAEGRCAQLLHIGPFANEGPTIARVHDYIEAHGQLHGKHHEIYLSDITKADPAKWRTIIRQPMR